MKSTDEQSTGVLNPDGSMTFKKIPPGGAFEMLRQAFEASKSRRKKPEYEDRELQYLGMWGKNLKSVPVKMGNFCLKFPETWNGEIVKVDLIDRWTHGFFFAGPQENEWTYVQHMTLSPDHVNDDIEDAVDVELAFLGGVTIHPPKGGEVMSVREMLRFGLVPAISSIFLKRHKADKMASWIGTFRRGGMLCRLFILCLQRGRDVWKVEYVFPAQEYTVAHIEWNGKEQTGTKREIKYDIGDMPSEPEQMRAGVILGNFRAYDAARCQFCGKVVQDEDTVEIPLENVDVSKTLGLPIRTDYLLHPYCCPVCKKRLERGKIGVSRIESIPYVAELLGEGARIKEEWVRAHRSAGMGKWGWITILVVIGILLIVGVRTCCSDSTQEAEKLILKAGDMEDGQEFVELMKARGHKVGTVSLCNVFTWETDFGDKDTIAQLKKYLEDGADADCKIYGAPLLCFAMERIKNGDMSAIALLFEHGANPNATDGSGRTALVLAVERGDEEAVRFLLGHRADPNAAGKHGENALTAAIEGVVFGKCSLTMVQLLLENGANPNQKYSFRETVFSKALFWGRAEVIKLLIEHGADPNAKDALGHTVVSKMAAEGNLEVVSLLLDRGAKFGERDGAGRVLEKAARSRKDKDKKALLKLLIERGMGPVTDQAIISAWWNKEARDYLLAESCRSADDFDVLDNGELKSVRVKQPNAKEAYIKEMVRREKARKIFEERERMRMSEGRPRGFRWNEDGMRRSEEEDRKRQREYEKKLDEAWLEYYSRQEEAQRGKDNANHKDTNENTR